MDSAVVIKVKYEETLRRFNARIIDGELELNMKGLIEKILSLFMFTPDAELVLTYIDEDNDVVTLSDDDDLRDVVRQALNPLRITVKVRTEMNGRSSARTSGTTTPLRSPPLRSPPVQLSSHNVNSSVQEILNSVPEPIRRTVTKIWADVSSAGTPSRHTINDMVQCFSEMGLQYLNQLAEVQAATRVSRPSSDDGEGARVEGAVSDEMTSMGSAPSKGKDVHLACESNAAEPKNEKDSDVSVNGGVKALAKQVPGLEYLKAALDSTDPNQPCFVQMESSKMEVPDKFGEALSGGKDVNMPAMGAPPVTNAVAGDKKAFAKPNEPTGSKRINSRINARINAHAFPCYPISPLWTTNSQSTNPVEKSVSDGMTECPYLSIPFTNGPVSSVQLPSQVQKERRNNAYGDESRIVFHPGVRCDGCGVHPITGPRFKSKVKDDYDLCSICFIQMGDDNDYVRMDRPLNYRHPHPLKGLYDLHHRVHSHAPVFRCGSVKPGRPKLDSRFIQDVNVLDGTIMAPLTPFTKIWRMRNNGSVVWPQGAQLVWIGGDKLSNVFSVAVEIPPSGLAVDEELDVAVDFVAPEHPGRYISYWRMASPSGQKFGQRVWVLIQVDGSSKEMPYEGYRGLINLNLPPVSNGMHGPEIINVNFEPMREGGLPAVDISIGPVQLVEPVVDASREKEQEPNFPINDSLLIGDVAGLSPLSRVPSSSVSYPVIDLSELAPAVPSPSPSPATLVQTSTQDVIGKTEMAPAVTSPSRSPVTLVQTAEDVNGNPDVEEALLRDLEEMGFKQVDLNKEILRLNEYDLEKSVDDLCGVSGWDPILEELHEMGFVDKATNTKLLQKNNGSIKRVVMDLLAGEE